MDSRFSKACARSIRSPSLLLTGYPHFETALRAIQNEIDGYVVKLANVEELVNLIERKLLPRGSTRGETSVGSV